MFRRGGMSKNEGITAVRSEYMGGGMTGIMSGIIPRPDAGITPRIGLQDGTTFRPPAVIQQQGLKAPNFFTRNLVRARNIPYLGRVVNPLIKVGGTRLGPYTAAAAAGYGLGSLADYITKSGDTPEAYALRKQIMKEDPYTFDETNLEVGDALARIEAADVGEKYGFFPQGGKAQRLKDLGLEGEFDAKTGERKGERIKKLEKEDDNSSLDTTGGEKNIKDEESALMKAYKEYAPIFEKELGVSPEDTKKQLYLQLAKFGAGVAAQPGGDLVGAIGKAAMPAIEGAGATIKDQSSAKRQAKLLALQTAISEGKPGPIATGINDIAKIYGVSKKEAAAIYEKWNARTAVGQAERTKRLTEFAEKRLNVNPEGFSMNIEKLLKDPELKDLVGEFNKKLPTDKNGAPDPDEMVDKEYYVGENGRLYRVDKSVEPPRLLEPGDKGFKDSKKKSSTNKK